MSGARISVSPISTASTPDALELVELARGCVKPDSETTVLPGGHVGQQLVRALEST